jgi:hypothetical protein
MKKIVIKKGHFSKKLSKHSYNRNKLMVKKKSDNNLLDTLKNMNIISKNVEF